jgi:hypothetical protein
VSGVHLPQEPVTVLIDWPFDLALDRDLRIRAVCRVSSHGYPAIDILQEILARHDSVCEVARIVRDDV